MEVAEYVKSTQNRKSLIFFAVYIYIYIYILRKECHSCFCVLYDAKHKGMRAIFQKKGKKAQNIWKFGQKCTKFENILKKGSPICATIAHMKQLEYALNMTWVMKLVFCMWWGSNKSYIDSIISGGCGQLCPNWFKTTS